MERESMEFDVLVVGAGPAGLSAAIRLKQLNAELNVCVVEKGSEVGAHILSGAVFEPRALNELLPEWREQGAPLNTPVTDDEIWLLDSQGGRQFPNWLTPKTMHNDGNYIISLGNLCRWLAEQAEGLGVEIYPGFSAAELIEQDGVIAGVITGDMGVALDGSEKDGYMPGMELRARYTLFAEGCRGHLGKALIARYQLDAGRSPQHYGLGFKEIWQLPEGATKPGKVVHTAGWPLSEHGASGGSYLYHADNNQVLVGLIVDLNYDNPNLNPFEEFQRFKTHPEIAKHLEGGERISYGARAIAKGGFNSLPKMSFPGGLLIGCDAGTLNFAKIKGSHTAMKSGMLAAEVVAEALSDAEAGVQDLTQFEAHFKASWLYDELYRSRNFGPALHKFGSMMGGAFNTLDQNLFGGRLPITLKDEHRDHAQLQPAAQAMAIQYPKPDGKLSFDRLSSVFLSNTYHEEDQPCHLKLTDAAIPVQVNLTQFDEPAQRYCPAGVYEIVEEGGTPRLQINAANCIHCKTCDIKDPSQNITWVTPEGGGGPNYPNM
ncbi:electron transfer flavoprotein-ubiquinone oxidoreductase [Ferrimonas balearica]|uniref:electron transfer flavoprotein-ubiquinone oxidoreductase n=1 Tax=Ferrimonas balearica TaxID=44012 RepID=UPI001F3F83C0|nr:electron transfer flavoprotein-ubiquinone oxidoreductase [Ferrimonas balearica]MBY6019542.1 electron transfer flavoprotein-ubiquinone oxidoreductase [Halomonas denitrificans]MBY6096608.1 electron transfer flavoprotein-ubiquinone oxidoreductase [Ferrimonas balearica]